jgi:hypothetical protein
MPPVAGSEGSRLKNSPRSTGPMCRILSRSLAILRTNSPYNLAFCLALISNSSICQSDSTCWKTHHPHERDKNQARGNVERQPGTSFPNGFPGAPEKDHGEQDNPGPNEKKDYQQLPWRSERRGSRRQACIQHQPCLIAGCRSPDSRQTAIRQLQQTASPWRP